MTEIYQWLWKIFCPHHTKQDTYEIISIWSDYKNLESAKKDSIYNEIINNFLENFLAKPHEELLKQWINGNVCPFTKAVLKESTVLFTREHIDTSNTNATRLLKESLINQHIPIFLDRILSQLSKNSQKLACIVIHLDWVSSQEECNTFVTLPQKEMQPDFVMHWLLLSELHPHNTTSSARNDSFFPSSQTPYPIYFIRKLISTPWKKGHSDIPYIVRLDRYDKETCDRMYDKLVEIFWIEEVETRLREYNSNYHRQ